MQRDRRHRLRPARRNTRAHEGSTADLSHRRKAEGLRPDGRKQGSANPLPQAPDPWQRRRQEIGGQLAAGNPAGRGESGRPTGGRCSPTRPISIASARHSSTPMPPGCRSAAPTRGGGPNSNRCPACRRDRWRHADNPEPVNERRLAEIWCRNIRGPGRPPSWPAFGDFPYAS